MDRFINVEQEPAAKLAECENNKCRKDLYLGDEVIVTELEELHFCDEYCLMAYLGATRKELDL